MMKVVGQVKIAFLLCRNRGQCDTCPNRGAACLRKRREVVLLSDLMCELADGRGIYVKQGFVFDGASIPRIAWPTTGHPLDHEFIRSVVFHDATYAAELFPRAECDWIFLESLQHVDRVSWYTRNKMYSAVRAGGWTAWQSHTPETIADARRYVHLI